MFVILLNVCINLFLLLANAYIYEMEGPSFSERWAYWVSRTPEQRLWSAVKNETEKLFRQAHFAVSITLNIRKFDIPYYSVHNNHPCYDVKPLCLTVKPLICFSYFLIYFS